MTSCKPLRVPMDTHQKLHLTSGDPLANSKPYQCLVGKLIHPYYYYY